MTSTREGVDLLLGFSSSNNQNILEETDDVFNFPAGSLKVGEDNIITIVQV